MITEVKCEKMFTWDFEQCNECKRFRVRCGKGLNNWGCAHNEATATERHNFGMIWATAYLRDRGYDIGIPEVNIIRVSKRKKKG